MMRIKRNRTLKDFIDMEQMELRFYSEEHVTPHDEAYRWYLANPNTDMAIEDGEKIIAFSDILPLKNQVYERILDGSFNDKYLTGDDMINIEKLNEGEHCNLLLSCVVVHEDYRKTEALKLLLDHHLGYYREAAAKDVHIDWVLTSNVTEDGEGFSERMGFERIGKSSHGSTLYRIRFSDFDQRVKLMKSRLEELLLGKEQDLLSHELCRERSKLERLLSDDFLEYGTSGTVYSKRDTIDALCAMKKRDIEIHEFEVDSLGPYAAVAHYTAFEKKEKERACCTLRTSIWRLEEGEWKLLFHQGTCCNEESITRGKEERLGGLECIKY
ncbi:MAG: hypothetical protein K0Q48_43 [Bacillota bacterium]|nr:hypothetical protein [Bacillota bacterium]